MKRFIYLTINLLILFTTMAANADPNHLKEEKRAFLDLKYGCFIHWNHSAIRGDQISFCRGAIGSDRAKEYDEVLTKQFTAKNFDADKWARLLKDAGFKYVVLVPKHHDGFCMFKTKASKYNSVDYTPFGKDYIKLMSDAARKQGLKVCLYYSITDWKDPNYGGGKGADLSKYNLVMRQHLKELFTNYGEITALWTDGQWDPSWTQEQGRALYKFLKKMQPKCLISNRIGPMPKKAGPIGSIPGSFSDPDDILGDYLTPERVMSVYYTEYPWEACLPLDKQNKWSWMPTMGGKLNGFDNRSKQELIHWLLQASGGGGNFLLGIGPDQHGSISPYHAERLLEVGSYLRLYGDTIYKTQPGPYKPGEWDGVSLFRGKKMYLHVIHWKTVEGDYKILKLPKLPAKVTGFRLVTGGIDYDMKNKSVLVEQTDTHLIVKVNKFAPHNIDTIIELTLDKDAADIKPIDTGKQKRLKDHTPAPGDNGDNV